MNFTMLAGPLIGAVIGYLTNNIAVKMLFRPLRPVKIGKYTLPFTPGIIPKGQSRLARAVGSAVGNNLLTEDVFEKKLLSDETIGKMENYIDEFFEKEKESDTTLEELLGMISSPQIAAQQIEMAKSSITERMTNKIKEANLGAIVSDAVVDAAKKKIAGSFLEMMVSDNMLRSIAGYVEENVEEYIEDHGEEVVGKMVDDEADNLMNKTVGEVVITMENSRFDWKEILINAYKKLIRTKGKEMVQQLDIPKMVEERVNAMDVLELEELVMSVMKKELNAIVNLGALIGFVMGLLNLLF
ncbi:MAG: DUF445 domain-containing protein [Lachnospiraceae bacterium]